MILISVSVRGDVIVSQFVRGYPRAGGLSLAGFKLIWILKMRLFLLLLCTLAPRGSDRRVRNLDH